MTDKEKTEIAIKLRNGLRNSAGVTLTKREAALIANEYDPAPMPPKGSIVEMILHNGTQILGYADTDGIKVATNKQGKVDPEEIKTCRVVRQLNEIVPHPDFWAGDEKTIKIRVNHWKEKDGCFAVHYIEKKEAEMMHIGVPWWGLIK